MCFALQTVNSSFRIVFQSLLPSYTAQISTIKHKNGNCIGINFIIFSRNGEVSLNELSGGQNSILSLSFVFSLLLFKASPFYILDEIDAALDFCFTQNISHLISGNFSFAQFIIVSLKKQIISDARVVFEVKQINQKSFVTRLKKKL